jgi:putative lipoic acid-binding regulatory protein
VNTAGAGGEQPSLIEYPCDFPLKILGHSQAGFAQAVLAVVKRHAPDFDDASLEMKTSKKGKYLSVTCVIRATSREQLDALYQELCDHPMVVMVL